LPSYQMTPSILSNETPIGLSPGLTLIARPRRGAVGYAWALAYTSLAAGFHPHMSVDMLLWKAEVQYGCRYTARQSHGR
jgi:hypothetical protein